MTQKVHRRISGVQLREESQLELMHVAPHPGDEGSHPSPPVAPLRCPSSPEGSPVLTLNTLEHCSFPRAVLRLHRN